MAFYTVDNIRIKYKNAGPGFRYNVWYGQTHDTGTTGTLRLTIPSEQNVILKAQNTTLKHVKKRKRTGPKFS